MAIIYISPVDKASQKIAIATPTDMQISIMDLSTAFRNAKGEMSIDRIATKRKLELRYAYLSRTDLSTILNAVSSIFFDVYYTDPQTNSSRTATFYVGDRNTGLLDVQNGIVRYKDVAFNLVEK